VRLKLIHVYHFGLLNSCISFLYFKQFNKNAFCTDLHWAPSTQVLNCTDPDKALAIWYNVYLTFKRKQVKHPKLPLWCSKEKQWQREKRINDRKMFPTIQETKKYSKTNLDFQFMHRDVCFVKASRKACSHSFK